MSATPKDCRYEAFSTGWQKTPHRLTHLPTGIVITAQPGDTKADLYRRLDAELAKAKP